MYEVLLIDKVDSVCARTVPDLLEKVHLAPLQRRHRRRRRRTRLWRRPLAQQVERQLVRVCLGALERKVKRCSSRR
jgi:DNA-binding TFAR19-related protein (PDSD5 family)